jgi:2TM domain
MKQLSPSQQKRGFNIHAFVFATTMALLLAINLSKGEPYWILWVLLGWGIGLLAHWWFVLGPGASTAETT